MTLKTYTFLFNLTYSLKSDFDYSAKVCLDSPLVLTQ